MALFAQTADKIDTDLTVVEVFAVVQEVYFKGLLMYAEGGARTDVHYSLQLSTGDGIDTCGGNQLARLVGNNVRRGETKGGAYVFAMGDVTRQRVAITQTAGGLVYLTAADELADERRTDHINSM